MKEQGMTSAYLSTNRGAGPIRTDELAGPEIDEAFLREERAFRKLSLEDKVAIVMSAVPRIFQLETTSRCNLRCPLCSTHHLKRGYSEMDLESVRSIMSDNPQAVYACLHLMGEPLMSRSLFPIVRCLKEQGVYTYFASNGMLLGDHAATILDSGLDKISISLDGITQVDLARYRVGASLDRVLSGIRTLKAERRARGSTQPLIQTQTIMFSYNEEKEEEVVRFLKSLGVDRIKLKRPSFDTFGGKNDASNGFLRQGRGGTGGKYSRESGHYIRYRDRAVCRLLFQGFALSDGSVVPCCIDYDGEAAYGNIHAQSWREIQASEARRKILELFFKGELSICRTCSLGYGYAATVYDRSRQESAGNLQAASRS
jgi:MoaA/NifB/PqqE/SkfB family radical SAM enzyme